MCFYVYLCVSMWVFMAVFGKEARHIYKYIVISVLCMVKENDGMNEGTLPKPIITTTSSLEEDESGGGGDGGEKNSGSTRQMEWEREREREGGEGREGGRGGYGRGTAGGRREVRDSRREWGREKKEIGFGLGVWKHHFWSRSNYGGWMEGKKRKKEKEKETERGQTNGTRERYLFCKSDTFDYMGVKSFFDGACAYCRSFSA